MGLMRILSILLLMFYSNPIFAQSENQLSSVPIQENVVGPEEFKAQGKPHRISFKLDKKDINKNYFIEIINGDGRDLVLNKCNGRFFLLRLFCTLKNKVVKYFYLKKHAYFVHVKLNRKTIVKPKESKFYGSTIKPIKLKRKNDLKIKVKGHKRTSVKIRIFTEISDQAPIAKFNSQDLGNGQYNFDGSISNDNGEITEYKWDFGDGTSKNDQKVSHTYLKSGTYQVSLTVKDDAGLEDTTEQQLEVTVPEKPIANLEWGVSTDTSPYLVYFYDQSEPGSAKIENYNLEFGDGKVTQFSNSFSGISHEYLNSQVYSVKLTVRDENGLTDTKSIELDLTDVQLPVAVVESDSFSGGLPLILNLDGSNSYSPNGNIESFAWSFQRNNENSLPITYGERITQTFDEEGIYTGTLTIIDAQKRMGSTNFEVKAGNIPDVFFDYVIQTDDFPLFVDFVIFIDEHRESIERMEIDYGDGNIESYAPNVDYDYHWYDDPGIYTATLTVYLKSGLTIVKSHEIDVRDIQFPEIRLTGGPYSGPAPLTVNFDASETTSENGNIHFFQWDFTDDGIFNPTSDRAQVSHTYTIPGTYTVHVQAQDRDRRRANKYFEITVEEPPSDYNLEILAERIDPEAGRVKLKALLSPKEDVSPEPIPAVIYRWDLGDGSTSDGSEIFHNYSHNGPFEVVLQAELEGHATIFAKITLNNIYQTQDIETPSFLLVGNNVKAPTNIMADATRYLKRNPGAKNFIWRVSGGRLTHLNERATIYLSDEGEHSISLQVQDEDGFIKQSETKTIAALGKRAPIYASFRADGKSHYRYTYSRGNLEEHELPAFVKFDASQSGSSVDEEISYEWNINGERLVGKVVYYNFLEKGSYIAKLTVRDESGHSVVREMGIDVDDSDCIRSDGDDLCPKFLDYPNKILPFSQSSWDLTTVLESGTPLSGLAPVQTQIESSTRWMKPYQPESNIYYDFSDQVTISGAAINIPQNILENEETRIRLRLREEVEFVLSVTDDQGEYHTGTIAGVRFGIGSARINVPENSFVEILSIENRFYKQYENSPGVINLNDLGPGVYSVTINANGVIKTETMEIKDQELVLLDTKPQQMFYSASLKSSTTVKPPTTSFKKMTPREASEFVKKISPKYSFAEYLPKEFQFPKRDSVFSTSNFTMFNQTSEDNYASWLNASCDGTPRYPTQFPLKSKTKNEFEVEGVESWMVAAFDTKVEENGQYQDLQYGPYLEFGKVEPEQIFLKSGKRSLRLMCQVGGHGQNAAADWFFKTKRSCCGTQSCAAGFAGYIQDHVVDMRSRDNTPVTFKFTLRNPETGEEIEKIVSESHLSAASKMGLASHEAIASHFGVDSTSGEQNGLVMPHFTQYLKIPNTMIDPELKIEIESYPDFGPIAAFDYNHGCYIATNDGYVPVVNKYAKVETLSQEPSDTNEIQRENSDRMFEKDVGKFALNWGVKPFAGFRFDPIVPVEISVENSLGVSANRLKLTINHNSQNYEKIMTNDEFALVERKEIEGETVDIYRINLNTTEFENNFIWDISKTLRAGIISVDFEWDYENEKIISETDGLQKPMTYNLSRASGESQVCAEGYYGNYNPFATADFAQRFRRIEPTIFKARCNDIGHPFGNVFLQKTSDGAVGHEGRGHRGGFGIDIRYPNSMMHFGEIDAFDSSGRYNHVIKMRTWVNELKDHYALGSSHTALEDICSDASNQLIANECFNLGKIGSKYLIQSVVKFCHLVSEKLNEADYRSVCKEFPVSSAKILSINTAEIRRAVDAISATSNRTNVIIGKGEDNWLWGLVSRGEFTPGFNLIEYDTQHNVFNDQFMPTWQNGAVHYTPRGHSGHIHLDLE